jgi:hypothetical protein
MELRDRVAIPSTAVPGGSGPTDWAARPTLPRGEPSYVRAAHHQAVPPVGGRGCASSCSNQLESLLDDPHIAIWAREFGLSHQVSSLAALALLGEALTLGADR